MFYNINVNVIALSFLINLRRISQKEEKKLSIFQRYQKAYKEYGKILISVHVATSVIWFGSFYYVAISLVPLLGMYSL